MKNAVTLILLFVTVCHVSATVVYVNKTAAGTNTGTSWANAFTDLQNGIAATGPGDEIWVAAGTYKPTSTSNQQISFDLPTGVKLYGGFAGTETLLTQRDWNANVTILSGDIGSTGTAYDNSYSVVFAYNVSSNTRLDGFKIQSGYASDINYHYYGGGMYIESSSLTVANCTFTGNYSANGGGALAQTGSGGSTTGILNIINCNFFNNNGGSGAALFLRGTQSNVIGCNISDNDGNNAIYVNNGSCTMDRCIVSGNNSSQTFGTVDVYNDNASINIYNSLFTGNVGAEASAVHIAIDNPNNNLIWNCTFAGNKSTSGNPSYSYAVCANSTTSIRNCIFWGNSDAGPLFLDNYDVANCLVQGGYTGSHISTTDPKFVNPGNGATAPFNASGYDYTLQSSSPAINAGNNTNTSNIYNKDLADSARISAITVDLGCYERQYCSANVSISASGPTSFCTGGFVTLTASLGNSYLWSNNATSASTAISTSGSYQVNVVDTSGCFGSASQTVTVYPASVQITGTPTICNGGSTTLTATSPDGSIFAWSSGDHTAGISVTQAGTYTVTVTTINSCTASSAPVTVVAHTVSTPVVTQNGYVLTSSAATGNQWYLNGNIINGATGSTYTVTQDGNYTDIVTESACSSTVSNTIDVLNVGITEEQNNLFDLYPNPAINAITVEAPAGKGLYQLLDVTGKSIQRGTVTSTRLNLDLTGYSKGVYFFTITDEGRRFYSKVVKE